MPNNVKKGSYWRHGYTPLDEVVVYKALQDGSLHEKLHFCRVKDKSASLHYLSVAGDKLCRCKKDGSWFGVSKSPAQIENQKWLSIIWQAKGAAYSLYKALERTGNADDMRLVRTLVDSKLAKLEKIRQERVAAAKAMQEKQK